MTDEKEDMVKKRAALHNQSASPFPGLNFKSVHRFVTEILKNYVITTAPEALTD
jgi:hypothetical protein